MTYKYKFKVCIEVKSRQNCFIYVAVNFLSQVFFFLFQLDLAYFTVPKNKRKTKINLPEVKKINYNVYIKVWLNLDINGWYTDCFGDK